MAGVSGGPDSLCLLDLLHRLGYPLVVAHFNHQLRAEAGAEAQAVQRRAASLGLPAIVGAGEVRDYAGAQSLSLEEAARTLRYRFLFEAAQQVGAQAVAVGHTADDQVETVLMHLLRGAGLSGLRGMAYRSLPSAWSQTLPLVRPLLGTWRAEVLAYVAERGLSPSFDPSNLDPVFYRNRLRHELIPILETYNPQARAQLWRMAQVLGADYDLVRAMVEVAWEACREEEGPGYIAFARQPLTIQPVGVQRRLLRKAIAWLRPGLRDVDFEAVERGLALLALGRARARCDLAGGLRLFLEGARVYAAGEETDLPSHAWPQLIAGETLRLEVPGTVHLPAGWELQAESAPPPAAPDGTASAMEDPFQAWISADELQVPLLVRPRLPGDRFQPLGLAGRSQKLSDFMINVKLPERARARWPLVVSAGEVVWVPGYRLAHPFRLTPETRRAIYLRLRQLVPAVRDAGSAPA